MSSSSSSGGPTPLKHPLIGEVPAEMADLVADYRAAVAGLQAASEALARMGMALAPMIRRAQRAARVAGESSEPGGDR